MSGQATTARIATPGEFDTQNLDPLSLERTEARFR